MRGIPAKNGPPNRQNPWKKTVRPNELDKRPTPTRSTVTAAFCAVATPQASPWRSDTIISSPNMYRDGDSDTTTANKGLAAIKIQHRAERHGNRRREDSSIAIPTKIS